MTQPTTQVNGSVTVRARSSPGNEALANVAYQVVGTSASGVSDPEGVINVTDLSAGSHALRLSAPGYATTLYTFTISSTVVHVQRDVPLLEKTGSMTLTVYSAATGDPAANALVRLDRWRFPGESTYYNAPIEFTVDDPTVPTSGHTDANGELTLTNVPAATLLLSIPGFDSNGDGIADSDDAYAEVDLTAGTTVRATIVLRPISQLFVVSSNLQQYGSTSLSDSLVYFVFSDAMDTTAAATRVGFGLGYPNVDTPLPFQWTSPIRLEVALPASTMLAGASYRLSLNTRSLGFTPWIMAYYFVWNPPPTARITP